VNESIDQAIAQQRLDELVELLADAGVPTVRYAARRLSKQAGTDTRGSSAELAEALSESGQPAARQLSIQMALQGYRQDAKRSTEVLRALTDDADWPVRDAASEACGRLLRAHFEAFLPRLEPWRRSPSAGTRRAVVIAALRAMDHRHLERAEPLLRLLEPLLTDSEPLVRRSLGPSALGTLLECYPTYTFEYLVNWSTANDPQVLWNVAMTFSTPAAAQVSKKALIVLRKLSLDPRRFVWRAVATAMWKLGRRRPDIVRPELARWLEDEERIAVAREALRYL
jgi:hypothetical protein